MKLRKFLKILVPVSIISFLLWTVFKDLDRVLSLLRSSNLVGVILSLFLLTLTFLGGAFFWQKLLFSLKNKLSYKDSLKIFTISNFGRFIPGIVIHYLARVYMLKQKGLSLSIGTASVVLEAYYTFLGGAILSILALPSLINQLRLNSLILYTYIFFISLLLIVTPNVMFGFLKKLPLIRSKIAYVNYPINISGHLFFVVISLGLFFLNGSALYFLSGAFNRFEYSLFLLTGMLTFSWVIGFLTPVAPGGLGVSDLSLAYLFSLRYDFPTATFLVLLYRIGMILSEGLVFLMVLWMSRLNIFDSKNNNSKS